MNSRWFIVWTGPVLPENGWLGTGKWGFRLDTHLTKDRSVLLWSDLCFLVHNHFGNRHIRVLLFCLLNGLSQSLKSERETTIQVSGTHHLVQMTARDQIYLIYEHNLCCKLSILIISGTSGTCAFQTQVCDNTQ